MRKVVNVLFWLVAIGLLIWSGCNNQSRTDQSERIAPLLEGMGDLFHKVTTNSSEAQRFFNQGLVLSYGFNHAEAKRSFQEAARIDPGMAMAHWGVALVLGPNINAAMEDNDVPEAYASIQKAIKLAPKASKKEQAYIKALSKRYAPQPVKDRSELDRAYADAMRQLAKDYPNDIDALTLSGEALMDLHPWDFWEKDGTAKEWTPEILSTLEKALEMDPNHPGANHLYIHAVEASDDPARAEAAADRLRDLVPGAGHLVHMPAHIYIRVGRYNDGSVANEKAIEADNDYITQCRNQGIYPLAYHPHNYHFLWATATMEGRDDVAIHAARKLASKIHLEMLRMEGYGTMQHFYSIPYYALARFARWDEILKEPAPPADLVYPTGVWTYARGLAQLRSGDKSAAEGSLKTLQAIAADSSLEKVTIWDINTTAHLMKIAVEVLDAEILAESGKYTAAVAALKRAVELEDNLNYDEPYPWYAPVRQTLGAVLLEAGETSKAEAVFREDMSRYPENGWALYGLKQSLEAQGKTDEALAISKRFEKAWVLSEVKLTSARL